MWNEHSAAGRAQLEAKTSGVCNTLPISSAFRFGPCSPRPAEAFVQQKCFKAVQARSHDIGTVECRVWCQVFARQTLMCPDLAFNRIASEKMSAWLGRLVAASWWRPETMTQYFYGVCVRVCADLRTAEVLVSAPAPGTARDVRACPARLWGQRQPSRRSGLRLSSQAHKCRCSRKLQ